MAKVTIGGNDYEIQPLNFKALKKLWPHVATLSQNPTTIEESLTSVEVAIIVIAADFERDQPEKTVDWIEENLKATEVSGLQTTIVDVMVESGLIPDPKLETPASGEAKAPKKTSTATSTA